MINNLLRLKEILAAFANFYWQSFVCRRGSGEETEKKRSVLLRQTLEKLGAVYVKLGQFLALRPDFLSPTYSQELFFLLENVPPFPYEKVVSTFQKEFGKKPEELFSSFDKEPLAAASFGQVHRAILKTGEEVAVKIQRPGIKETIRQDISLMRSFTKITDTLLPITNKLKPMVNEFERWTYEELDYTVEAAYTESFHRITKDDPEAIFAPRVYKEFSSQKILTTDYIEGLTLNRIILAYKANDRKTLGQLEKTGFSREDVAMKLLKNTVRQIYLDGFFHADPHPANIIYTKEGRLAYIDFGIVGRLSKSQRLACLRLTRSALYGDNENAFEALTQLCDTSKVKDMAGFKEAHGKIIKQTLELFEDAKVKGKDPHVVGGKLVEIMKLMQKYKAVIPFNTLRYFRTMPTMESVVLTLYPEMEIENMAGKFRDVSLLNLVIELPGLVSQKSIDRILLTFLNTVEKEIIKTA